MTKFIDKYLEPEIIELLKKIGCDECNLFSFKIIKDFSKFISFISTGKEMIVLIFSSFLSERERLADITKSIGRQKRVVVYVFFLR